MVTLFNCIIPLFLYWTIAGIVGGMLISLVMFD